MFHEAHNLTLVHVHRKMWDPLDLVIKWYQRLVDAPEQIHFLWVPFLGLSELLPFQHKLFLLGIKRNLTMASPALALELLHGC